MPTYRVHFEYGLNEPLTDAQFVRFACRVKRASQGPSCLGAHVDLPQRNDKAGARRDAHMILQEALSAAGLGHSDYRAEEPWVELVEDENEEVG